MKGTLIVSLLIVMVTEVVPQCLTENDRLKLTGRDQELQEVVSFGLQLYKELEYSSNGKNLFFSPYSIWAALVLAYYGSGGNTEEELRRALGVSDKITLLAESRALELTYELRKLTSPEYTFTMANQVYIDSVIPVRECISKIMAKEVNTIDFSDAVSSAKTINDFVSNVTQNMITSLLEPSDLVDAGMVLVNAAMFVGKWSAAFPKENTHLATFRGQYNDQVYMMNQTGDFLYGEYKDLRSRVLELPYKGGAVSMFLLLPEEEGPQGFSEMVERLSDKTLEKAISHLKPAKVNVQLPTFNMSVGLTDELEPALRAMGIHDLFDATHANLSAFSPSMKLSVGKSVHKAFVEVTEEGTAAGASTALAINIRTRPTVPVAFVCDRPFMFLIYDNDTKNILFLGTMRDASKV